MSTRTPQHEGKNKMTTKTIEELEAAFAKLAADYEIARDGIFESMRMFSQVLTDKAFATRDVVWADYCNAQEELGKAKLQQRETK